MASRAVAPRPPHRRRRRGGGYTCAYTPEKKPHEPRLKKNSLLDTTAQVNIYSADNFVPEPFITLIPATDYCYIREDFLYLILILGYTEFHIIRSVIVWNGGHVFGLFFQKYWPV